MNGQPDDDDDEGAMVIVCQGPPRCSLEDEEAVAAQVAGCVWCKRIAMSADGSETVQEPGNA